MSKTKTARLLVFILGLVIFLTSCKKEIFPDKNDIVGNWIEITTNSDKTQLRFDVCGVAYLTKPNQPTDTFSFSLDDSKELLCFSNDAGMSFHQIELNKKTDEITIWSLFPSIPENPSETRFEKE